MPSMRKSRRGRRGSGTDEIPVASFSDIAFLLIIFFIIVTTLIQTEGFEAEIPAGEKSEQQEDENTTVQLSGDKIYLNEKPVDIFTLREELIAMDLFNAEDAQRIIMLEESGRVTWQMHVEVMAAITKAGGVVTKVIEDEEEG